MNIFIAGGTGAIGRVLVPLLVNAGYKVVALTRSADRTSQLQQMGAVPVVGDVYDEARLVRLGARRYPWKYQPQTDYVVLEDHDRNLFCVVQIPESQADRAAPLD